MIEIENRSTVIQRLNCYDARFMKFREDLEVSPVTRPFGYSRCYEPAVSALSECIDRSDENRNIVLPLKVGGGKFAVISCSPLKAYQFSTHGNSIVMLFRNGHPQADRIMGTRSLSIVDLFVGGGGLSEGFKQAGFTVLAANDFDADSANTFKLNNPDVPFLPGPIQKIRTADVLDAGRIQKYQLDVLIGGPPCQAFSVYNHKRGMHDDRSGLFREYIRIVEAMMPRFVVMENVTGMSSVERGKAVKEIYSSLEKLGYHVEHRVLKAEEFGVPQQRRRIFFIGSRDGTNINWPKPTHGTSAVPLFDLNLKPVVTVWDAIGDLPELQILEGLEIVDYTRDPISNYQSELRRNATMLFNHVAPGLAQINIERMKYIPQGGSWRDIPERLLPAGMKKAKRSDHTKRYGRLDPNGLASTILTKCDPHWGAFIHPTQDRTLTVREAARLQSFPDRVQFTGSRSEQFRQVGNAVPPLLARAVAQSVLEMLERTNLPHAVTY